MMAEGQIILYHYAFSPYARRIIWYLALRGIPYIQCIQPPMMPRPDIARLGIGYRRIPILAIGKDVYLDSRLQIQVLENLMSSSPRLGSSDPEHCAIEYLLSTLMTDAGIFGWAASLLPSDLPLLKDPKFLKDREDFSGMKRSAALDAKVQPVALRAIASVFDLLETTLLSDGRKWVLKTEAPSLADIEAVWPLHWLVGIPGALPVEKFSGEVYPRVYAWIERFDGAIKEARGRLGRMRSVQGKEASCMIVGSEFYESGVAVDETDAEVRGLGLKVGDEVVVGPTDMGRSGRDVGRLAGVDKGQFVYEVKGEDGLVRVHAPRHGFKVRKNRDESGKL